MIIVGDVELGGVPSGKSVSVTSANRIPLRHIETDKTVSNLTGMAPKYRQNLIFCTTY